MRAVVLNSSAIGLIPETKYDRKVLGELLSLATASPGSFLKIGVSNPSTDHLSKESRTISKGVFKLTAGRQIPTDVFTQE